MPVTALLPICTAERIMLSIWPFEIRSAGCLSSVTKRHLCSHGSSNNEINPERFLAAVPCLIIILCPLRMRSLASSAEEHSWSSPIPAEMYLSSGLPDKSGA